VTNALDAFLPAPALLTGRIKRVLKALKIHLHDPSFPHILIEKFKQFSGTRIDPRELMTA